MNIETTGGILQVDSRAGIENFEALNNVEVCNEEQLTGQSGEERLVVTRNETSRDKSTAGAHASRVQLHRSEITRYDRGQVNKWDDRDSAKILIKQPE